MTSSKLSGHLAVLFTVVLWSTTFISTKILLQDFTPFDILLIRFVIGFLVLKMLFPKSMGFLGKNEFLFVLSGMFGVSMYFLIENYALTMTTACNVGIILSATPLFTAIAMRIFYGRKIESPFWFYLGFISAFIGILMLSLEGNEFKFSPIGDSMAALAGIVWSLYCVVLEKINRLGFNSFQVTRRSFLYGVLLILPFTLIHPLCITSEKLMVPQNLGNLLFLGVGASAICFALWNVGVKKIGSVSSIIYLYLSPAITVIFAYIFLGEKLSVYAICGCVLVMLGLFLSNGMLNSVVNQFRIYVKKQRT